jgi:hypothetical protein
VATFELVIGLATSRVFCRLAPGSVQPGAAAGLGEPLGVLALAEAEDVERHPVAAELLLLVHPAAVRPAATSRVTLATAGRLAELLI